MTTLRKGQKLCNWILETGYSRDEVHVKLFHMSDEEFDKAVGMDVDYEIAHSVAGDKIIRDIVDRVLEAKPHLRKKKEDKITGARLLGNPRDEPK